MMFTTVTVTKWWKSWCKGINEKQVISNPLTEDKWKNLQVVPNLRDFQSSRLKDQRSRKACGRKKKQNKRWKAYVIKILSKAFRIYELPSTNFLNRAQVFPSLDLASSYAPISSETSKHYPTNICCHKILPNSEIIFHWCHILITLSGAGYCYGTKEPKLNISC